MSGIVGIFHRDGKPVDPADLTRMVDAIAHRGPDGCAIWHDGPIGFGHRMLWTTPESLHETLPLYRSDADVAITADARIDNRDELMEALGIRQYPDKVVTDSELILEAYLKWGEHSPEKLLGDFAFAIWDGRKKQLFCARDHTSIKPFFYCCTNNLFIFGSEIKALFALNRIPVRVDPNGIIRYLEASFEDKINTLYQNVFRLTEATSLAVSSLNLVRHIYWTLDATRELSLKSDKEYEESLLSLFKEAIECRLRSVYPVGSCLSGGLDSSSIVCVARDLLKKKNRMSPLHTFSAVFPGLAAEYPSISEYKYMESVINQGGLCPHFVPTDISPIKDTDKIMWVYDGPNPHFNIYIHWALVQAASQNNVRILLSGTDGDTTISYGIEHLIQLARTFKWMSLHQEIKQLSRVLKASTRTIFIEYVASSFIPTFLLAMWRKVIKKTQIRWNFKQIIRQQYRNRNWLWYLDDIKNACQMVMRSPRYGHVDNLTAGMILMAPEIIDRAAGMFSVEMRYPFYDKRLREYCVSLPYDQKLKSGWTRSILRRAMKDFLPEEVLYRTGKGNLLPNLLLKLGHDEKETIQEIFMRHESLLTQYIDHATFKAACNRFFSDPINYSKEAYAVFLTYNLLLWLSKMHFK
jgi:asparagine synthase (glutamine-hydrolysing)